MTRDRAVDGFRSGILSLGRVSTPAMIPAGRLHGIVLVRRDLWQLIENWLRKFALLKIE